MTKLSTGIPNLDAVLGGGLQGGSLVYLVGGPGAGKTILAQQICFSLATPKHKALYYTMLSEPHPKLIDHLGSFDFFDRSALGERVEFLNLSGVIETGQSGEQSMSWDKALDVVVDEVAATSIKLQPSVIVIDSIRALRDVVPLPDFRDFVYKLASRIAHTNTLLILVGEYSLDGITSSSEFAVGDGIIYLANEPFGRFDQRWLRVVKMRGNATLPGKHSFRIGTEGISVYPRFEVLAPAPADVSVDSSGRVPFGISDLDDMTGGGLPRASSTLIAGPSGAGKTVLGLHFMADGIARGERCLYLSFQQTEHRIIERARTFGWDFEAAQESGLLSLKYLQPVEISLDMIGVQLLAAAHEQGVKRVVIDSLAEIEPAARGTGRFPDFLSTLVGLFRSVGATSLMTSETTAFFGPSFELPHGLAFVADNVILLRYAEMNSQIHRVLGVMKMRDGNHDKSLMEVQIDAAGLHIVGRFAGLTGVLEGTPSAGDDVIGPVRRS